MSNALGNFNPMPADAGEAREQCVVANRILANEGILDAFGHISVRNPERTDRFFQSYSMPSELVTRSDIIEFDVDGNHISGPDMPPFREVGMHAEIYRARSDVNAICHCHTKELVPFAITGVPLRPLSQATTLFYQGVPLYRPREVTPFLLTASRESCLDLVRVLGSHRAVLVQHHGAVIVGENTIAMVTGAFYLRENAQMQKEAMQLGTPEYLSDEEGEEGCRNLLSNPTLERMWRYWVKRMQNAMPDMYW